MGLHTERVADSSRLLLLLLVLLSLTAVDLLTLNFHSRKWGWANKGLRKEIPSYGSVIVEFQFAQFFDPSNPINFGKFQLFIH